MWYGRVKALLSSLALNQLLLLLAWRAAAGGGWTWSPAGCSTTPDMLPTDDDGVVAGIEISGFGLKAVTDTGCLALVGHARHSGGRHCGLHRGAGGL